MTVGELMAELEGAPRGATVRALVIGDDIVARAVDVDRVHFAGAKSTAERVPKDIVIVASIKRARVRSRVLHGGSRS